MLPRLISLGWSGRSGRELRPRQIWQSPEGFPLAHPCQITPNVRGSPISTGARHTENSRKLTEQFTLDRFRPHACASRRLGKVTLGLPSLDPPTICAAESAPITVIARSAGSLPLPPSTPYAFAILADNPHILHRLINFSAPSIRSALQRISFCLPLRRLQASLWRFILLPMKPTESSKNK